MGDYVKRGGPAWPTTGPEDLSQKGLSYSFVYGNSLFIVIDAYYLWGNAEFHANTSDHGMLEEIDAKQLASVAWLSNWAKKDGAAKGVQHIFLISHAPLLTEDRPNNSQLKKVMADNPMFDALLAGHRHVLDLSTVTLEKGSVYQLIDGTASGDNDDNSYLRIEVDGARVTVTAVHTMQQSVTWTK